MTEPAEVSALAASVSACASALALLVSFGSFYFAKRAYRLAASRDARLQPALTLQLTGANVSSDSKVTTFLLDAVVINLSDATNSVREGCLVVELDHGALPATQVVLQHSTAGANAEGAGQELLKLPAEVPARRAVGGRLVFEAPLEVIPRNRVLSQVVELTDTFGNVIREEIYIVSEKRRDA